MRDFLSAAALVLVIEGLLYAISPGAMKRMMARAMDIPDPYFRMTGLIAAIIGVVAVWLIRRAFE